MFRSFNVMMITLIEGLTGFCSTFKHLGDWSEETSKAFVDEARADRKKKLIEQEREMQALISQA